MAKQKQSRGLNKYTNKICGWQTLELAGGLMQWDLTFLNVDQLFISELRLKKKKVCKHFLDNHIARNRGNWMVYTMYTPILYVYIGHVLFQLIISHMLYIYKLQGFIMVLCDNWFMISVLWQFSMDFSRHKFSRVYSQYPHGLLILQGLFHLLSQLPLATRGVLDL